MSDRDYKWAFVRLKAKHGAWLVDPTLRGLLVERAQAEGVSLTTYATKVLAERYRVPFVAIERNTKPSAAGDELNLRLPAPLYRAIERATPRPATVPDAIRAALSAHFGLRVPAKAPRRRRAVAA